MTYQTIETAKPPARLNIPQSSNTVKMSVIDTTGRVTFPAELFHGPVYKGLETLSGPAFSFLIEHPSGKRLLFDLGISKDWEALPPSITGAIKHLGAIVDVEKNVSEILEDGNVHVKEGAIDAVIWSHSHFDHTGDLSTFPKSTELVVGKEFTKTFLPAYPENQQSALFATDFEERKVTEISFDHDLKIGRFAAHDYFGDGSFYLLDSPGHMVGHMCGLARTTASPPTFVLLGGDASHHAGELRPTEYLPLPTSLDPSPIPRVVAPVCPGHIFVDIHSEKSVNKPFLKVTQPFNHDLEDANWSIAGLQEIDSAENILVVLAHDATVEAVLDFFPKTLNNWQAQDAKRKTRWIFLSQFEEAVKDVKQ